MVAATIALVVALAAALTFVQRASPELHVTASVCAYCSMPQVKATGY